MAKQNQVRNMSFQGDDDRYDDYEAGYTSTSAEYDQAQQQRAGHQIKQRNRRLGQEKETNQRVPGSGRGERQKQIPRGMIDNHQKTAMAII